MKNLLTFLMRPRTTIVVVVNDAPPSPDPQALADRLARELRER